jgi:2-oxoisovalerate dehydrogenase E1 component
MAFPKAPAILESRNLSPADLERSPRESLLRIYAWMQLARAADNRILELFRQGLIKGTARATNG